MVDTQHFRLGLGSHHHDSTQRYAQRDSIYPGVKRPDSHQEQLLAQRRERFRLEREGFSVREAKVIVPDKVVSVQSSRHYTMKHHGMHHRKHHKHHKGLRRYHKGPNHWVQQKLSHAMHAFRRHHLDIVDEPRNHSRLMFSSSQTVEIVYTSGSVSFPQIPLPSSGYVQFPLKWGNFITNNDFTSLSSRFSVMSIRCHMVELRIMQTQNMDKISSVSTTNTNLTNTADSEFEPNIYAAWDTMEYGSSLGTVVQDKLAAIPNIKMLKVRGYPCRFVWHSPSYSHGHYVNFPASTASNLSSFVSSYDISETPGTILISWPDNLNYQFNTTPAMASQFQIAIHGAVILEVKKQFVFNLQT
jgi:hypothetical protein